jgi:uncharacterized protein YbjT (DUF2867 family)
MAYHFPMAPTSTRTVFVTGAGGFVGSAVVSALTARGYRVVALVRAGSPSLEHSSVSTVRGDLLQPAAWRNALAGCDAVIHLVGIIREDPARGVTFQRVHVEATQAIVDAARNARIHRYVHMSAIGSRQDAVSQYHRTKFAAEEYVRRSGLDWTIFRPSVIHGERGEFMRLLARWAGRRAGVMPYFGRGMTGFFDCGRLQPVYVHDVARAFADALDLPVAGRTYDLVGPDMVDWPTLYRLVGQTLHRRVRALPVPAWYGLLLTRLLPARWLPFNRDQILMACEDSTGNLAPFAADFGWAPRELAAMVQNYAPGLLA